MLKDILDRIESRLETLGLSATEASKRAGLSADAIRNFRRAVAAGKESGASIKTIEKLAAALGTTTDWLATGSGPEEQKAFPEDLPNATLVGKVKGGPVKVPVYGQAVGGQDGEFFMNGNVLFDVLAPPVISEIKNAYAIAVSGSSMSPRYEEGEICFIDPTRRVKTGDYVVAQIKINDHDPPLAYIKRLVRWTTNELVLEQFNPPKQIAFPHAQVHTVNFVAMAGIA